MWLSPAILESNHLGIHPGCFSICNKLTRVFSCTTFGHFENSFPKKNRGLILPHQLSEHIKKGVKSQDVAIYPHTVVFGLASYEVIAVIDCNICNTSCFLEELLEKSCCLPAQVTRNPSFVGTFFSFNNQNIVYHHQLPRPFFQPFQTKTQHHSQKIGSASHPGPSLPSRGSLNRLGSLNGQRRLTPLVRKVRFTREAEAVGLKGSTIMSLCRTFTVPTVPTVDVREVLGQFRVVGWLVGWLVGGDCFFF